MGSQIRGLGVSFCAFPQIQVLPAIPFQLFDGALDQRFEIMADGKVFIQTIG